MKGILRGPGVEGLVNHLTKMKPKPTKYESFWLHLSDYVSDWPVVGRKLSYLLEIPAHR